MHILTYGLVREPKLDGYKHNFSLILVQHHPNYQNIPVNHIFNLQIWAGLIF